MGVGMGMTMAKIFVLTSLIYIFSLHWVLSFYCLPYFEVLTCSPANSASKKVGLHVTRAPPPQSQTCSSPLLVFQVK